MPMLPHVAGTQVLRKLLGRQGARWRRNRHIGLASRDTARYRLPVHRDWLEGGGRAWSMTGTGTCSRAFTLPKKGKRSASSAHCKTVTTGECPSCLRFAHEPIRGRRSGRQMSHIIQSEEGAQAVDTHQGSKPWVCMHRRHGRRRGR